MKKLILIGIIILALFLIYSGLDYSTIENGDNGVGNGEVIDDENFENEPEEKAKIAIIIDDLGYNPDLNKELLKMEEPLTVAIMPFLKNTEKAVDDFKGIDNFELILHMPLEPMGEEHIEEKMIMTDHSQEEIRSLLNQALSEMKSEVEGINNHKGSKFTSDREKMRQFLEVVKENNLFFVDSFTINTSVGFELAKEMNAPTAKRDIFLDFVDDPDEIRIKLHELEELAMENGSAIAIGHHKENTLNVLQEELPKMQNRGVRLVKVSELLN